MADGEPIEVSRVTADAWEALSELFGRSGASNGCGYQYWLLGPEYRRRDRSLNRQALRDETARADAPGPGLIARTPDGTAVGWARLTPRSSLAWLHERFRQPLPDGADVWSMPCFYVGAGWRGRGVMSALIGAGVGSARTHGLVMEGYPVDPTVDGATRNRFAGVLQPFLRAGFTEVSRLANDRALVRYDPGTALARGIL
jgi:GNAT superfamily N-acetyltransferase